MGCAGTVLEVGCFKDGENRGDGQDRAYVDRQGRRYLQFCIGSEFRLSEPTGTFTLGCGDVGVDVFSLVGEQTGDTIREPTDINNIFNNAVYLGILTTRRLHLNPCLITA